MALDETAKKAVITDSIRGIPDFPHKGILFWDVTTIMLNHEAFKYTIELFAEHYKDKKVDVVAGTSSLLALLSWKAACARHPSLSRSACAPPRNPLLLPWRYRLRGPWSHLRCSSCACPGRGFRAPAQARQAARWGLSQPGLAESTQGPF